MRRGKGTQRRRSCEDGCRNWSDVSTKQGMLRTASRSQKVGERLEMVSPSEPPEGSANTCIQAHRLLNCGEHTSVVSTTQCVAIGHSSPWKLTQRPPGEMP